MKLRTGKIISISSSNASAVPKAPCVKSQGRCRHHCENYSGHCCACSDLRPHTEKYIAFNKASVTDFSYVARHHYYCPTCKAREEQKEPFVPPPPTLEEEYARLQAKYASALSELAVEAEHIASLKLRNKYLEQKLAKVHELSKNV